MEYTMYDVIQSNTSLLFVNIEIYCSNIYILIHQVKFQLNLKNMVKIYIQNV